MSSARQSQNEENLIGIVKILNQMLFLVKGSDKYRHQGKVRDDQLSFLRDMQSKITDEGYGSKILYERGYFDIMMHLYFELSDVKKAIEFHEKVTSGLKGHYKDEVSNKEVIHEDEMEFPSMDEYLGKLEDIMDAIAREAETKSDSLTKTKELLVSQTKILIMQLEKIIKKNENTLTTADVDKFMEILEVVQFKLEVADCEDDIDDEFVTLYKRVETFLNEKKKALDENAKSAESSLEQKVDQAQVHNKEEFQNQGVSVASVVMDDVNKSTLNTPLTNQEIDDLIKIFENYKRHIVSSPVSQKRFEKTQITSEIEFRLKELKKQPENSRPARREFHELMEINKITLQDRRYGNWVYRLAANIITKVSTKGVGMWSKLRPVTGVKLIEDVDAVVSKQVKHK